MKPIYKILIIVGVVLVVGFGIYLAWSKIAGSPSSTPAAPNTNQSLPIGTGNQNQNVAPTTNTTSSSPQRAALKKISDDPVFDFWVMPDTKEIYYFNPSGQVLTAKDGPDLQISSQKIDALNSIAVAASGRKVLAAFGNPNAPQWGIFDALDKVWRPLSSNILNAAWGTNDNQLIVLVFNNGVVNLSQADLLKSPPAYKVLIKDFRFKNISLTILPNQKIIITEKSSALYPGGVWQLDPKNLTLNLLESAKNGLTLGWSHDKSVAFQFSSPNNFVVLQNDLSQQISDIFESFPSKCDTASSTIYCFEPQNFPTNLSLPDDYFQKKFYSTDNLFALSLNNGAINVNKILVSGLNAIPAIDAKNPQILNDTVYFINRYDNYLYAFSLGS